MSDSRTWFKAKTYGWGWGAATTWQGWLTYALYGALMAASVVVVPPGRQPVLFGLSVAILSVGLVGICLLKGEKPGWRRGR